MRADEGGVPRLQSRLSSPELAKANRVSLNERRGLVALPLEQNPAKVALVDVRNASALRLAAPVLTLPAHAGTDVAVNATTYCAAFDTSGTYLYVFAAQTATMYVYAVDGS